MMNSYFVGQVSGEKSVYISSNSPNNHILISGISGSGKSYRIKEIEQSIVKNRGTVVELDINGTYAVADSVISAKEDGLNLTLLDIDQLEQGKEARSNLIGYITGAICPKELRGACQQAAVREAIEYALLHRADFSSDMKAIAAGLKVQKTQAAIGAYNHLYEIFEGDYFRNSHKSIIPGKLNVISLQGINPRTQRRIIEIFLSIFWRNIRMHGQMNTEWTLVIDEFQNLDLGEKTVLFQMLTESRKYNVSLILATQTLSVFTSKQKAVLSQAAIQLFFRQTKNDVRQAASWIDTVKKEEWEKQLKRLRVGEAIAVGDLQVNGRDISQPVITRSCEPVYGCELAIDNCRKRW